MANDLSNKYDFKNFLLSLDRTDYSQEGLIFWKNKIPLPLDLIYGMYDQKQELISAYIDHLLGIIIYTNLKSSDLELISIDLLPNPAYISENERKLTQYFNELISHNETFELLIQEVCFELNVQEYRPSANRLITALAHKGKKYSRIYIHPNIRKIIIEYKENILLTIGTGNNDMFGNVICDYFNIYRSGFSDAFASIFNHLIQFVINSKNSDHSGKSKIEFGKIINEQEGQNLVEYTSFLGGRIWEPFCKNGKIGIRINKSHVFINSLNDRELLKLIPLLISLCEEEYNSINDKKTRFLEGLREDISRSTRLKIEKE
jgi:hypothetical protein